MGEGVRGRWEEDGEVREGAGGERGRGRIESEWGVSGGGEGCGNRGEAERGGTSGTLRLEGRLWGGRRGGCCCVGVYVCVGGGGGGWVGGGGGVDVKLDSGKSDSLRVINKSSVCCGAGLFIRCPISMSVQVHSKQLIG